MFSNLPVRAVLAIVLTAAAIFAQSCGGPQKAPPAGPQHKSANTKPTSSKAKQAPAMPQKKKVATTLEAVGLDPTALDKSADPCTDFYQYACGGWIKRTKIPGDKTRWVRSFSEIHERNEKDLHDILEQAAATKRKKATPVQRKIGAYYRACMNEKRINARGKRELKALLRKVRKVRNVKQVDKLLPWLHRNGVWAFFDLSAEQDFKDATRVIAVLDQAGLGLPDRDYYLKDDKKSKQVRAAYVEHVAKMLQLAGERPGRAKRAAAAVMHIETALAKVSKTRVQRRDPKKMYNKINIDGVAKLAPAVGWKRYFAALGKPGLTELSVTAPKFFSGLQKVLTSSTPRDLSAYLTWHVVHSSAHALPKAFVDESFKMKQVLTGQKMLRARWKRCVASTDHALGELLAQPFIKLRFAGDSKASVKHMVKAIGAAFSRELKTLQWMDDKTRALAREKMKKMAYLIGYPSKWRKYKFKIGPSFLANSRAARAAKLRRALARIGKPVDRERWEMSPPTVNAYYHPLKNHMVFPAGILQPPFFNAKADVAVNMGGMGMVVGHELTHGFDDQGSQFDALGNLRTWWTPTAQSQFKARTGCVVKQYSRYEPLKGLHINGALTQGENIADMGGVKLAYSAFEAMTRDNKTEQIADGLDERKQFFLSVGQIWCAKYRPDYARMAVRVDPHSPPRFRVNGALSDLPAFAEAFSCKPGTPMNPTKACAVW